MNIIRAVFLSILVCFSAPVLAQVPEDVCAPAEVSGGTGTSTRLMVNANGWGAWHWCKQEFSYRLVYGYGNWRDVLPNATSIFSEARKDIAAWRSAVRANLTNTACQIDKDGFSLDGDLDPTGIYMPVCRDLSARVQNDLHVMRWNVVPLLAREDGSRPLYRVVSGVRTTTPVPGMRAEANAPCTCNKSTAIPSGNENNRFCPVVGKPQDLVTLCRRS